MWKKMVIAALTGIVFLSCARNGNTVQTADTTNEKTPDNQALNVPVYQSEEDKIRDLLHTQDELTTKWNRTVLSLKKVNFGIPGGDN
jgi:peptidoglycan hydrolase CwlO-like protein